jgi:hypothetical protein
MNSKLENRKAKLQEESEKFEDALSEEFSEFSEKAMQTWQERYLSSEEGSWYPI